MRFVGYNEYGDWVIYFSYVFSVRRIGHTRWEVLYRTTDDNFLTEHRIVVGCDHAWVEVF